MILGSLSEREKETHDVVEGESGGGWRKRNPIGGFKAVYVVIHGGSGWVPGSATANRQGGVMGISASNYRNFNDRKGKIYFYFL